MANHLAMSHVRRVDTLGAISSISGASKLTLAPRRHQMQMKLPKTRCLKPVAVATPHLPDERLPKKAEKESPRFSFWERTPAEHFIDYLESRLPPGPRRRRTAVNRANLVSIFWTTGLPLLLWICPWVPWGYLDSVGFLMSFYVVAMIFDWFCFVRLWVRRMYELEMKEFEMKELERKEIEMEGNDR